MSATPAAETLAARPSTATEGPTRFSAYAVVSRSGPHVTMQAGVVHARRFWTTTSGRSLKARSVAAHRYASVTVADDDGTVRVLAGRTARFRPFRPLDVLSDPWAPLRSPSAVVRLGVGQAEQLVGYFEAAAGVPADWLPHRRVLLVTRLDDTLVLRGNEVVDVGGTWARTVGDALVPSRGRPGGLAGDQVPGSHRGIVAEDRPVHLGVSTPTGPVALPARWLGDNRFAVSAPALRAVAAALPGPASAVFDDSESRRPDEKLGAMFRGSASLADLRGDAAEVLVHTERITTWNGFEARTEDVR